MPRINSIIYRKEERLKPDHKVNCCQYLHTEAEDLKATIPLQYLYSHRDISVKFEEWLIFIQRSLGLDFSWELVELDAKGWRSHKECLAIHEKFKGEYYLSDPQDTIYAGTTDRALHSDFNINNYGTIVIAPYSPGNLTMCKRGAGGSLLVNDDRLPSFKIPGATIDFPTHLAPEHNGFKYITWYMIRFYLSYLNLGNFILDYQKELEKLIKKYDISWYNIFFALWWVYPISNFGTSTCKKITNSEIEMAFDAAADNCDWYDEEEEEQYEFDYEEDELNISEALHSKYGKSPSDELKDIGLDIEQLKDNSRGVLSIKESSKLLEIISIYLKTLHK